MIEFSNGVEVPDIFVVWRKTQNYGVRKRLWLNFDLHSFTQSYCPLLATYGVYSPAFPSFQAPYGIHHKRSTL